jgi:hypothetical protein
VLTAICMGFPFNFFSRNGPVWPAPAATASA